MISDPQPPKTSPKKPSKSAPPKKVSFTRLFIGFINYLRP
jgi:hypothetical protein